MTPRGILASLTVLMFLSLNIACRRSPTESSPIPNEPKPQPGYTFFVVKVLDNAGIGVNNVGIEITGNANHQAITDSLGTMNVQLPYGNYNISVTSFGFDGSSRAVELNSPNQELTFNLLRINAIRITSIEPPCGTLNLPYIFNALIVKVEFSVAEPYEYPILGFLNSALSIDGSNIIPNSGTGTQFGYTYHTGQTTVGLLDYHRNTIRNTTHILHEMSVKHINDAGKPTGVILVQARECPLGFN